MLYLAMIGFQELVPILIVLLLLFGAKKLPELARAMGSSIKMFKSGLADEPKPDELESGEKPAALKAGGEASRVREAHGESSSQ